MVADAKWDVETVLQDIEDSFDKRITLERENQLRKLNDFIQNKLRQQLAEPIQSILNKSEANMWSQVQSRVEVCRSSWHTLLQSRLEGFQCTENEIADRLRAFDSRVFEVVREAITDKSFERVQSLLQKRFQTIFVNNRGTLPRQWTETDDVRAEHARALAEVPYCNNRGRLH